MQKKSGCDPDETLYVEIAAYSLRHGLQRTKIAYTICKT